MQAPLALPLIYPNDPEDSFDNLEPIFNIKHPKKIKRIRWDRQPQQPEFEDEVIEVMPQEAPQDNLANFLSADELVYYN